MRIVSLVPNATEILFALGLGEQVVGVSHECDHPPAARLRPQLTGSALPPGLGAAEVDRAVSAQLADGKSLYSLDEAAIAALAPDLIVTQELCPVCAVSTAQVDGAVAQLARCPELVSLDPRRLADIFADIRTLARRLEVAARGEELVASLEARLAAVAAQRLDHSWPRVVAVEWLDPPFLAGHWVPEMIAAAGGIDLGAGPGDTSRRTTWEEIDRLDPDLLLAMPCGFDEAGAAGQLALLAGLPSWERLRAVRSRRVVPLDANGLFSRPGPRVIDGVERLAAVFAQLA